MGAEGQAHAHLPGPQATLSSKVSSSSAALAAPHQVLPVLQQPAEIISRSHPPETPQNASSSNPATALGMTQALPLSQSQQANVTSSPDHRTQPSEATAEWVQGQSLTISTVRSASLNRFASQQLRSAPADLLAHSIHSSATQSGQFEPASSQRTVLPQQSGAITRLLQNDEGTNLEIASSAQHLLKEFEDATITAATEYRTSSALLCEEVCGAFHDASLPEDSMSGQEDRALPLSELTDFLSDPDALYHSERLTGPLTAASSGLHTQAHTITALPEADATEHSHGHPTVAADGVQLVKVAAQNATAADEVHGPGGKQPHAASIGTQPATGSADGVSPDAVSNDAAQQDSQYIELRGFTGDEIEESADDVVIRESSVADLPSEADVLQIAALMSGKHSLRVEDLYSVCAHWQQMAGPHHKVLQNFGSSDLVASCQHIHRVLGESGRFVMCGQTEAGVMQWCLRHLDGVGNSSDQGEPWLASGQDFTDRMERSRAAGVEEQVGKASLRHWRQHHARAVQEQQRILADCMPRFPQARSRSKKRNIRPEWHQVKLASGPPQQKRGKSKRKGDGHHQARAQEQSPGRRYFTVALPQQTPSPEPADRTRTSHSPDSTRQAVTPSAKEHCTPEPAATVQAKHKSALKVILKLKAVCGTNKQQLPGTDLPVVIAQGPPTSSKTQCTASDSALAALPGLTALVNEDIFQHHFTGEEQQALLRLLPKADQQAACAGHNPLASTHLKAAAATYLHLLQAGLLEDEGASCWLPSRCRCPVDERHREARVQQWASRHFGQDAAHALTNGHTTAVELMMNIPTPEHQAMTA
ncbi:hypothetical protein WJX82_008133 [Trebouxia sp. C0006]